MAGVFSVSRDIFDHPVVGRDPERFRAWLWMVSRAVWKPRTFDVRGSTVTLERGQFVASYRQLADDFGWSLGATQRFLTRLKTDTMIDTQTDTGKMIITICNYDLYQMEPGDCDTLVNGAGDTKPIQNRYTSDTQKNKDNKLIKDSMPSSASKSGKKGSRMDSDWTLKKSWGDWAVSQGLTTETVRRQSESFRDYWISVPGQKGVKLDWEATWRNWIRSYIDRNGVKKSDSGIMAQIRREGL